ncbi:hypothetical protein BDN70DRAFT_480244 [Pholiota conissans]|uniref:Uncharacterized protein n=1 Tax=Pholiota conissans TaxID=109636 RepID=A0A9P5Z8B8_9AGAR|nr:hypothetical protein BDN70DRAFT_480244 [Pholiota conissans]
MCKNIRGRKCRYSRAFRASYHFLRAYSTRANPFTNASPYHASETRHTHFAYVQRSNVQCRSLQARLLRSPYPCPRVVEGCRCPRTPSSLEPHILSRISLHVVVVVFCDVFRLEHAAHILHRFSWIRFVPIQVLFRLAGAIHATALVQDEAIDNRRC